MKIKSINLKNNDIFGEIFFDFSDKNGNPYDTVILAGENGSGKTALLEIIFQFSNFTPFNKIANEIREFVIRLSDDDINILKSNDRTRQLFSKISNNELKVIFDFSGKGWDEISIEFETEEIGMEEKKISGSHFANDEIRSIFRCIYSDVEINFNPQNIQQVTSRDIDQKIKSSIKSSPNLATEITQLLIDIEALDAFDLKEWCNNNIGKPPDINIINSRIGRFEEAFNFMFPSKKYNGVKTENNFKKIFFEEFGNKIPIEKLSSGEKQIVFRGSFLLKDQKSNKGALVLIDEPEISLHPNWQLNILNFYKKLFTDEKGFQTSQMFFATHSPFIIHNNKRLQDKVIILKRDEKGSIFIPEDPEYVGWSSEEMVEEAYNIDFLTKSDKPFVLVEGKTDVRYIKKAAEILKRKDILEKINLDQVGKETKKGSKSSGKPFLDRAKDFFETNPKILKEKLLLLYDPEVRINEKNIENLYIKSIPQNKNNNKIKKGIENLFNEKLINEAINGNYIIEIIKSRSDRPQEKENIITLSDEKKESLCDWICNKRSNTPEEFKNFEEIFKIIESII